ncbi:MAG: hypothetical protein AAF658_18745, partial [Myxococcota bacterium]
MSLKIGDRVRGEALPQSDEVPADVSSTGLVSANGPPLDTPDSHGRVRSAQLASPPAAGPLRAIDRPAEVSAIGEERLQQPRLPELRPEMLGDPELEERLTSFLGARRLSGLPLTYRSTDGESAPTGLLRVFLQSEGVDPRGPEQWLTEGPSGAAWRAAHAAIEDLGPEEQLWLARDFGRGHVRAMRQEFWSGTHKPIHWITPRRTAMAGMVIERPILDTDRNEAVRDIYTPVHRGLTFAVADRTLRSIEASVEKSPVDRVPSSLVAALAQLRDPGPRTLPVYSASRSHLATLTLSAPELDAIRALFADAETPSEVLEALGDAVA